VLLAVQNHPCGCPFLPVFADTTGTEPAGNGPLYAAQHHPENVEEVLPTSSVQSSADKLTRGQYYLGSQLRYRDVKNVVVL